MLPSRVTRTSNRFADSKPATTARATPAQGTLNIKPTPFLRKVKLKNLKPFCG